MMNVLLYLVSFAAAPALPASLMPLDSNRVSRLREFALNGDMDSAQILAAYPVPPGKDEWLSDQERSFWLAICSFNGMPIGLNQESLLGPGNRQLRLGLLRRVKCPKNDRDIIKSTVEYRFRNLGVAVTADSLCRDVENKHYRLRPGKRNR